MAKVIVHISGDYPDSHQPGKTKAVSSLVDAVRDTFDQHVYSINRVSPSVTDMIMAGLKHPLRPRFDIRFQHDKSGITSVHYEGPPGGIYMHSTLLRLADAIAEDLIRRQITPDIFHGHKLTLEGLVAEKLSKRFNCPYALSIQVNTDRKILKFRPDLSDAYARIYHGANLVFPFSVMGQRICEGAFGARENATYLLPCTSPEDRIIAPRIVEPVLASVFHLKDYKNKNVAALVKASASLQRRHSGYAFHLYGAGSAEDEGEIDGMIKKNQALSFVRKGPIPHRDVQAMLNGKCGFAMVSKRETFGMVFLEALLAGCPVVFPNDWAIDGFFDEASFAIGADSSDFKCIEEAMEKLIIDQSRLKRELNQWQENGQFALFQRSRIEATYKSAVMEVIS